MFLTLPLQQLAFASDGQSSKKPKCCLGGLLKRTILTASLVRCVRWRDKIIFTRSMGHFLQLFQCKREMWTLWIWLLAAVRRDGFSETIFESQVAQATTQMQAEQNCSSNYGRKITSCSGAESQEHAARSSLRSKRFRGAKNEERGFRRFARAKNGVRAKLRRNRSIYRPVVLCSRTAQKRLLRGLSAKKNLWRVKLSHET